MIYIYVWRGRRWAAKKRKKNTFGPVKSVTLSDLGWSNFIPHQHIQFFLSSTSKIENIYASRSRWLYSSVMLSGDEIVVLIYSHSLWRPSGCTSVLTKPSMVFNSFSKGVMIHYYYCYFFLLLTGIFFSFFFGGNEKAEKLVQLMLWLTEVEKKN